VRCLTSVCKLAAQAPRVSCSTGSSAVYLARQMVQAGISDCVMALGFEKVRRAYVRIAQATKNSI
jgi:acetyl-CoA acetyltransferase